MDVSEPDYSRIFHAVHRPISIYLHFPYCTNLCSYCDFYKAKFSANMQQRLFNALYLETENMLAAFGYEPIDVATIYIGGGTPSLADPALIEKWIAGVGSYVNFIHGYEFTIEANPESLAAAFAAYLRKAGANRVVIGVQSFSTRLLKRLNRHQSVKDIYRAFYNARLGGFENIAADLIFGLPNQKIKAMRTDIERLTALEPTHVSFYQLTIEPGTPLARQIASGMVKVPSEDTAAEMYQIGSHMLIDRGYSRYEVSNFARDGFRCRHNYAYWEGASYIGLGPAAHGYLNNYRYANVSDIDAYIEAVEAGKLPWAALEKLNDAERLEEKVMLSLRTAAGIDKKAFFASFGANGRKITTGETARGLIKEGYLESSAGFLRLTDKGFLVADGIIAELLKVEA